MPPRHFQSKVLQIGKFVSHDTLGSISVPDTKWWLVPPLIQDPPNSASQARLVAVEEED